MKVFLMLVFCSATSQQCDVRWSTAIYPTVQECSYVAPSWLDTLQRWGWGRHQRKPTGVFCEVAKTAPKPYKVSVKEFQ